MKKKEEFAQAVVGMDIEEAKALAKAHGFKVMPIFIDGKAIAHIANMDGKRAKVSTVGGKVEKVVCWG